MEVLFGLANSLGYSEEDLLKARENKREADLKMKLYLNSLKKYRVMI